MTPRPSPALFRPPVHPPVPATPQVDPLIHLARQLGLDPGDWQASRFEMDGHEVLSMIVFVTPEMGAAWLAQHNDPTAGQTSTEGPDYRHPERRPNRRLSGHVAEGYQRQMGRRASHLTIT